MHFVVNHRNILSFIVEIATFTFVGICAYALQQRKKGKKFPVNAPVIVFGLLVIAAGAFMMAVTLLTR